MSVICLIDKDSKVLSDMKKACEEMGEIQVFSYPNLEAFRSEWGIDNQEHFDDRKAPKVDLIVFDYELLSVEPSKALNAIKKGLETQKYHDEELATRFILTSFDGVKVNLNNLSIHDHIIKPIEKLLFQQKVQIALNGNEKTDPSYLNLQAIKEKIEIGKEAPLVGFSDFGILMQNPTQLLEGAYVSFYSKAFGENKAAKVLARSNASKKIDEDKYHCRFDYYGMNTNQMSVLRRNMAGLKGEKIAIEMDAKPLESKIQIVCIDMDSQNNDNLRAMLESYLDDANILSFPSYATFLASCFPKLEEKDKSEVEDEKIEYKPLPCAENFEYLDIEISKDKETKVELPPDIDRFLGYTAEELSDRDLFLSLLDPRQLDAFNDFFDFVLAGNKSLQKFIFKHKEEGVSLLSLSANFEDSRIKILVKDLSESEKDFDYTNLGQTKINLERIDLLFIDASFIKNIDTWLEVFKEKVKSLKNQVWPKVVLTTKNHVSSFVDKYKNKNFHDLLCKPYDRSIISKKLLVSYLPSLEKLKGDVQKKSDIHFAKMSDNIMLATEVEMRSLSEFGISVLFHAPIRKDRFIHFYLKSFLGIQDYEPILARCYYSEEDKNSGKFLCYFTFLGVNDDIFKKIRVWLREYYIKNKDKG